jgi:hypothetical protein
MATEMVQWKTRPYLADGERVSQITDFRQQITPNAGTSRQFPRLSCGGFLVRSSIER